MKKAVLARGLLAFSAPLAGACEYQRSAQAKVDQTVVASIADETSPNMSKPVQPVQQEAVQPQDTNQE